MIDERLRIYSTQTLNILSMQDTDGVSYTICYEVKEFERT